MSDYARPLINRMARDAGWPSPAISRLFSARASAKRFAAGISATMPTMVALFQRHAGGDSAAPWLATMMLEKEEGAALLHFRSAAMAYHRRQSWHGFARRWRMVGSL